MRLLLLLLLPASRIQLAGTPPLDVLPPLNRVHYLHVLLIAPASDRMCCWWYLPHVPHAWGI
jgi:hypothetical protein